MTADAAGLDLEAIVTFRDPRLPERFWAKVRPPKDPSDCWEWIAARSSDGYGQFFWEGKSRGAHRVAFEVLVGPMPAGKEPDHVCRVRHCVNVGHLRAITHRENTLCGDTIPAVYAQQTVCIRGHQMVEAPTIGQPIRRQCRECNRDEARRAKRWKTRYQTDPEYRAHTLARHRAARIRRKERERA